MKLAFLLARVRARTQKKAVNWIQKLCPPHDILWRVVEKIFGTSSDTQSISTQLRQLAKASYLNSDSLHELNISTESNDGWKNVEDGRASGALGSAS